MRWSHVGYACESDGEGIAAFFLEQIMLALVFITWNLSVFIASVSGKLLTTLRRFANKTRASQYPP